MHIVSIPFLIVLVIIVSGFICKAKGYRKSAWAAMFLVVLTLPILVHFAGRDQEPVIDLFGASFENLGLHYLLPAFAGLLIACVVLVRWPLKRRRSTAITVEDRALQRSGPASRDTVDFPIAANWPGTRVSTLDDVILELHLSDAQRRRLAFLRYIHGVNTNEELSRDIPGIIQRIKDGRIQTVHR